MTSLIGNRGSATGIGNRPGAGTGSVIPKGYQQGRISNFSNEQHQLFNDLLGQVNPQSFLSQLGMGNEESFNQLEAPAHRQFAGTLGNIASRFSGMGLGGRKSSGFQNTVNQAASNFSQDLQSRRLDLMRQAREDLFGLSNSLLGQKPYENFLVEKPTDFLSKIFGAGAGALSGGASGFAAGGWPGAALGAAGGGLAGYQGVR